MSRRIAWCEEHEASGLDGRYCWRAYNDQSVMERCRMVEAVLLLDGIPEEWVEKAAITFAHIVFGPAPDADYITEKDLENARRILEAAVLESVLGDPE